MKRKFALLLLPVFAFLFVIALVCFQSPPAASAENYEVYFHTRRTDEWQIVCENKSSSRSDGVLSINFYGTSGPEEFDILVEYKSPGSKSYNISTRFPLSLDHGASVSIPVGTDYRIHAAATSGKSGYARFQIALS